MSRTETRRRIKQFLAAHTTLTLATVSDDGGPQAAPLFFAETDGLAIIFISERKARHSQNIARNNRVAAAIYADGQNWSAIQGVQLEGTCVALTGQNAHHARAVYLRKFSFIQQNRFLRLMLNRVTLYQITPTWFRLVDNTRGFGHKEELWPAAGSEN